MTSLTGQARGRSRLQQAGESFERTRRAMQAQEEILQEICRSLEGVLHHLRRYGRKKQQRQEQGGRAEQSGDSGKSRSGESRREWCTNKTKVGLGGKVSRNAKHAPGRGSSRKKPPSKLDGELEAILAKAKRVCPAPTPSSRKKGTPAEMLCAGVSEVKKRNGMRECAGASKNAPGSESGDIPFLTLPRSETSMRARAVSKLQSKIDVKNVYKYRDAFLSSFDMPPNSAVSGDNSSSVDVDMFKYLDEEVIFEAERHWNIFSSSLGMSERLSGRVAAPKKAFLCGTSTTCQDAKLQNLSPNGVDLRQVMRRLTVQPKADEDLWSEVDKLKEVHLERLRSLMNEEIRNTALNYLVPELEECMHALIPSKKQSEKVGEEQEQEDGRLSLQRRDALQLYRVVESLVQRHGATLVRIMTPTGDSTRK